ncbi:MAG: transaldolase family protein [Patescibacteria group bacterium]
MAETLTGKSEHLQATPRPLFFYDGADPSVLQALLDGGLPIMGVTTNPTLVAQHPDISALIEHRQKIPEQEALERYRGIVLDLHDVLVKNNPGYHSISVEPYCDENTTADQLQTNAEKIISLFEDKPDMKEKLLIKLPATAEGCRVAGRLIEQGWGVNGTLVFDQESALMWAEATKDAMQHDVKVVVSPFVGRSEKQEFEGKKHNGVDLVANIRQMYDNAGITHVGILAASIPGESQIYGSWQAGADIITAPAKSLREYMVHGQEDLSAEFHYITAEDVVPQVYRSLDFGLNLDELIQQAQLNPVYLNGRHPLAVKGLQAFVNDWYKFVQTTET